MFRLKRAKFLFALCLCCLGFGGGGGCRRAAKSENADTASFAAEAELKSGVPFATKEPENFQAEFVITANGAENKIFVARGGANRSRFDYNSGAANQLTVLRTSGDESFLILPDKKIYAENSGVNADSPDGDYKDFLTNEWLASKADAKFTRLGTENSLTKYAVRLNDSDAAEIIVFVDERINLPAREEFYSNKDGQKILTYAVEMKNFKAQADENAFEIPKDARKVTVAALRAAMRETIKDGQ